MRRFLPLAVSLLLAAEPADSLTLSVRARTVGHLPVPVHGAAVASDDAWIYIVGGEDDGRRSEEDRGFSDRVFRLRPDTGEVEELPPYPVPVAGAGAEVLDNALYVVGGNVPDPGHEEAIRSAGHIQREWGLSDFASDDLSTTYRLDLSDPDAAWERVGFLRWPRTNLATAVADGRIVAVGGSYNSLPPLGATDSCELNEATLSVDSCSPGPVERLDPASDEWDTGPSLQVTRDMLGAAAVDTTVVVAGGASYGTGSRAGPGTGDLVEEVTAEGVTYAPYPPEPIGLAEGSTVGDTLWFYSPPGNTLPARLFAYRRDRGAWAVSEVLPALHAPGFASWHGSLYLLGGYYEGAGSASDAVIELVPSLASTAEGGCGGGVTLLE